MTTLNTLDTHAHSAVHSCITLKLHPCDHQNVYKYDPRGQGVRDWGRGGLGLPHNEHVLSEYQIHDSKPVPIDYTKELPWNNKHKK